MITLAETATYPQPHSLVFIAYSLQYRQHTPGGFIACCRCRGFLTGKRPIQSCFRHFSGQVFCLTSEETLQALQNCPRSQWVKGGGLKFFLQLGSTGIFLSNFKVPRASFHFPHPIFLKFGTSRAQKLPKNSPNWPKWRFEGSGGPKWLEQGGTKLERTLGGPGQGF